MQQNGGIRWNARLPLEQRIVRSPRWQKRQLSAMCRHSATGRREIRSEGVTANGLCLPRRPTAKDSLSRSHPRVPDIKTSTVGARQALGLTSDLGSKWFSDLATVQNLNEIDRDRTTKIEAPALQADVGIAAWLYRVALRSPVSLDPHLFRYVYPKAKANSPEHITQAILRADSGITRWCLKIAIGVVNGVSSRGRSHPRTPCVRVRLCDSR